MNVTQLQQFWKCQNKTYRMEAPQYQCLTHFNVPRSKVSKKIIESQNVVKNFKLLALRKILRKRFQISAIKTSIIEMKSSNTRLLKH